MNRHTAFFLLPGIISLSVVAQSLAAVVDFRLVAEHAFISPDGVERLVVAANETFPGPTIRVRKGDTVRVTVTNNLDNEGLSIHWHGMWMRTTPWADGASYTTQCPMLDKQTLVYQFNADQARPSIALALRRLRDSMRSYCTGWDILLARTLEIPSSGRHDRAPGHRGPG